MHITLHRHLRWLALFALCAVAAGNSWSQVPDPKYISFLEQQSMIFQSDQEADKISGMGVQWHQDFSQPKPIQLVRQASVWLLYYPGSVITKPGVSVIGTWADPQFWSAAHDVGITLLHTDPVQRAGGLNGTTFTPTIDGWFDRISLDVAPELGTESDFTQMVANAGQQQAVIGSDLVPLHSGLGPDFRLAELAYKDYPGLYDMVEIAQKDWGLLPAVNDPAGHALVPTDAAVQLKQKGYIPGLIHSADADPQANTWSGWSATPALVGVDGKTRRWVYLHVFKPAQPAYNWLDPSGAAQRVQFGDSGRQIVDRGVKVLRLDADTFLGLEPQPDSTMAADYLTPLANINTAEIAFAIRKLGGFSYQEFAAPLAQLKQFAPNGPDLSYDFFTRAEVLYALINGDVLPLRLAHHFLLDAGVQAGTLVHDLQNHDEITFQLFELGSHDDFQYEGQNLNGGQLKQKVLQTMRSSVAGPAAPYNMLYRPAQDGIATTFAGFIAPALGVHDPYHATPDQVALIQRGHLLVAHANAMQPGVFAISAWDLVGALPIPASSVPNNLTAGGDWRWIDRGAVDLVGVNPTGTKSSFGIPKAQTLYGAVPDQLKSPNSFASQIMKMLAARKQYRIAEGTMLAVPPVSDHSVCVLVMKLPDSKLAITALNYGRGSTSVQVDLTQVPPGIPSQSLAGRGATDVVANQGAGTVSNAGLLSVDLDSLSGRTLVVQPK
ncbi:MAG: trehalose synthase [Gammaproteobacteria bacterium]|nr:trehalose synthase [Gammaproteobacteria bacterium]